MSTKYIKRIIDDYCVLDTETTGLSAYYDDIIEVGILKVRNNEIVDRYSQLIKPEFEVPPFITNLTGITNEMLIDKPTIQNVKNEILSFIEDDIILGHNTSFDIRFLNAAFDSSLDNNYMDTVQFARKVYPELLSHRLSDLVNYLNLKNNEHRAISDCIATKELYDAIKKTMDERGVGIEDLWYGCNSEGKKTGIDISSIEPNVVTINEESFFYGKHIVFTGKLEKMTRKNAMQIVVNLGGILDNNVISKTNYLILGNNDYNAILHGEKSSKHKKAEKLKSEGKDINIIDEFTFYDIINEEGF